MDEYPLGLNRNLTKEKKWFLRSKEEEVEKSTVEAELDIDLIARDIVHRLMND